MTNFLTKEGLEEIKVELQELKEVKLPAALVTLNEARSEGDLKENAAYDAAKDDRQKIEYRIAEIEGILEDYELIKEKGTGDNKTVEIGDTVEVEYINTPSKTNFTVTIVGVSEANAIKNKISNESPLASAVLGKKIGDEVSFTANKAELEVKIIKILG